MRLRLAYYVNRDIAFEGNASFTTGAEESSEIYNGGIIMTPWQNRWLSVSGTVGGGIVQVKPESLLIDADNETFPEAHAGIGLKVPLFRNLSVLADFRNYTLFNELDIIKEFQEYTVGLSYRY